MINDDYKLPENIYEGMTVKILDLQTGKIHESTIGYTVSWWGEGNGSCDCNRCVDLPQIEAELTSKHGEGVCFGNKRFLIIDILNNGCDNIGEKKDAIAFMNREYPSSLLSEYLNKKFDGLADWKVNAISNAIHFMELPIESIDASIEALSHWGVNKRLSNLKE